MTNTVERGLRRIGITISKPVLAVICILFGILFIVFPSLVGILIGIFFLIQGILLLTDYFEVRNQQAKTRYTAPPPPPPPGETPPSYPPSDNP